MDDCDLYLYNQLKLIYDIELALNQLKSAGRHKRLLLSIDKLSDVTGKYIPDALDDVTSTSGNDKDDTPKISIIRMSDSDDETDDGVYPDISKELAASAPALDPQLSLTLNEDRIQDVKSSIIQLLRAFCVMGSINFSISDLLQYVSTYDGGSINIQVSIPNNGVLYSVSEAARMKVILDAYHSSSDYHREQPSSLLVFNLHPHPNIFLTLNPKSSVDKSMRLIEKQLKVFSILTSRTFKLNLEMDYSDGLYYETGSKVMYEYQIYSLLLRFVLFDKTMDEVSNVIKDSVSLEGVTIGFVPSSVIWTELMNAIRSNPKSIRPVRDATLYLIAGVGYKIAGCDVIVNAAAPRIVSTLFIHDISAFVTKASTVFGRIVPQNHLGIGKQNAFRIRMIV